MIDKVTGVLRHRRKVPFNKLATSPSTPSGPWPAVKASRLPRPTGSAATWPVDAVVKSPKRDPVRPCSDPDPIVDDGLLVDGVGTVLLDSEGVPSRTTTVVDRGTITVRDLGTGRGARPCASVDS